MTEKTIIELSDDIRVPLHELQADLKYLIGRVISDPSCSSVIELFIQEKLKAVELAVLSLLEEFY